MSTVMAVCEDVWLSGIGQEFTEAWTRPVCLTDGERRHEQMQMNMQRSRNTLFLNNNINIPAAGDLSAAAMRPGSF